MFAMKISQHLGFSGSSVHSFPRLFIDLLDPRELSTDEAGEGIQQ
jgi:hypothetical protein